MAARRAGALTAMVEASRLAARPTAMGKGLQLAAHKKVLGLGHEPLLQALWRSLLALKCMRRRPCCSALSIRNVGVAGAERV